MKCPECDGVGYFEEELKEKFLGKTKYAVIKCDVCHGTGEINVFKPQTNEEYIRQCSTEELAEVFYNAIVTSREFALFLMDVEGKTPNEIKNAICKWLKEKHI